MKFFEQDISIQILGLLTLAIGITSVLILAYMIFFAEDPLEAVVPIEDTEIEEIVMIEPEEFTDYYMQTNLEVIPIEPSFTPCAECPLPYELQKIVFLKSKDYGINPAIVLAIMESESTFRADIGTEKILGGTEGGARYYGYMQLSANNCKIAQDKYGLDAHTPEGNIEYGIILLSHLTEKYGDLDLVITGYKAGEGIADKGVVLDCSEHITERVMYWEGRIVEE